LKLRDQKLRDQKLRDQKLCGLRPCDWKLRDQKLRATWEKRRERGGAEKKNESRSFL
jgi:hypothetical protein